MKLIRSLWFLSTMGTFLEWAEYTFYGYMALSLSALFFPEYAPGTALLNTFGIFAVGYLMRPLGAILFGHIGDRIGRRPALTASLILMGMATMGIGALPTYATIGIWAPLGLLAFRLLQGLAVSGEYSGAGIFLLEKTPHRYQCLVGSLVPCSAALGMVAGALGAYWASLPHQPQWAWRVPFLLGGVACFLGIGLRLGLSESRDFLTQKHRDNLSQYPLWTTLTHHKIPLLLTGIIAAIVGIYVYIGNIYFLVYLKQRLNFSTSSATFYVMSGEFLVCLTIPFFAWISDHIGPHRVIRWGFLSIALTSPFLYLLAHMTSPFGILLAMGVYGVCNGALCGPMVKIIFDLFPIQTRYTGNSLAWNVSAAVFSGTALIMAQGLSQWIHPDYGPGIYMSLMAFLAYGCFQKLAPLPKPLALTPLWSR